MAPSEAGHSPLEKNVKSGTKTASPSPIPQTFKARVIASVPFAQVTQCFTPTYSANWFSNSFTSGPEIYRAEAQTDWTFLSISSFV